MAKIDPFEKAGSALYEALTSDDATTWSKPWKALRQASRPGNAPLSIHGRPYSGFNALWLTMCGVEYQEPRGPWLTFKAAKERGGSVIKGSKATPVMLLKPAKRTEEDPETGEDVTRTFWIRKAYNVFHVEQVDWSGSDFDPKAWQDKHLGELVEEDKLPAQSWADLEHVDAVLEDFQARAKCPIHHVAGDRAFYRPATHEITLPLRSQFNGSGAKHYYCTALHEAGHATGAKAILDRESLIKSGKVNYARDELVAESCAVIASAVLGVTAGEHVEEHSANYIRGWLRALPKADACKEIIMGINQGKTAATWIINPEAADS